MTKQPSVTKAWNIYSEEGVVSLLNSIRLYIQNKIYSNYAYGIEYLNRFLPSERKQITLNTVTVSVEIGKLNDYFPYYKPQYPTEDDPQYEQTEVEALRTYTEDGDTVVVIGGGLGVTAVVAHRVTGGNVTVFEQSKSTHAILKRTVEINGCFDTITLQLAAVGNISSTNLTPKRPSNVEEISPAKLPDADLYEMDCEGAETTILRHLQARPSTLLVETHDNHDEVVEILESIGYETVDVVDDGESQGPLCTHIRAKLLQ